MRKDIPVYNIILNEENPDSGLDFVSLVDEPAIMEMGLAFSHMEVVESFQSYTDYPEAAKENAKIALRWAEENGWGDCGTDVGKQRANQLAKGEAISEETIARMAAFERHRQNSDKELGDGCGRLMWLAWGGDEGIEWAQRKLKQIREDKQEFIKPSAGESEEKFMERCVPLMIKEGKDQEQAVAMCISMYKEGFKSEFNKLSRYEFKTNKDKQVIVGPAMIPDLPIYRRDEDGEFYVIFTKEVIEKLADKFNKTAKEYKVNIDHDKVVESAFIKSNWIIEDKDNDKSKMYGFNLPEGTWFLEVKVEDENYWSNEVKGQNKIGFSVEGLFGLELIREKFNANTDNNNNNNNLSKEEEKMNLEKIKLALGDLTPEEIAQLQEAIAQAAPAEVVQEVTDAVVTVVEDQMPDQTVNQEMQDAAPAEAPALTEEMVAEMIQAKYDELLAMIAELKTAMEAPAMQEAPVEMSIDKYSAQLNFLKALAKKN